MIIRTDFKKVYTIDFVNWRAKDRYGGFVQANDAQQWINLNGGKIVGVFGHIDPQNGKINSIGFYVKGDPFVFGDESQLYGKKAGSRFGWKNSNLGKL